MDNYVNTYNIMVYINKYVYITHVAIYIYTHYAVGYFSISIMASYGKNTKYIIIKNCTHTYTSTFGNFHGKKFYKSNPQLLFTRKHL